MTLKRLIVTITVTAAVALPGFVVASPVHAEPALDTAAEVAAQPASGWTARGEDYPETHTTKSIGIEMSDGVVLQSDLTVPATADGEPVDGPFPVIVMITAYNKEMLSNPIAGVLAGGDLHYLVRRGYAYLIVDARGTGTSDGEWQVFGEREQRDAKEVVEWAAGQEWGDGTVGMIGPSYMGITQLFAAGQEPEGLKAIFPQVPGGDVYRDVTASGGQLDVGFMPLWLGAVTLLSLPPDPNLPPDQQLTRLLTHLLGNGSTSVQVLLEALAGGDQAYDSDWYRERSVLTEAASNVRVPTFLIGGHYDLFQRGTPMIFEEIQRSSTDVKMILGPWDHLEGSSGAEVADAGYGSLPELQLRWFDHHQRGLPDSALDSDIPDFTYYEIGSGDWVGRDSYVDVQQPAVFYLSGSSTIGGNAAELTRLPGAVEDGSSLMPPLPVAGLCSRSASQWTIGILGGSPLGLESPCVSDNTLNDLTGIVFESEPLVDDLRVLGPIGARIYASSPTGDGLLSVSVSRVTADGRVDRLTGGWQVISLAALDESRSRYLGEEIIQPWHPFTRDSRQPRGSGEVSPIDVEVFPTGAVINEGERLRVSVQTFDVPHLFPTLPQLPGAASPITVHNSAEHPSRVVLPAFETGIETVGAVPTNNRAGEAAPEIVAAEASASGPLSGLLPNTGAPAGLVLFVLLAAALLVGGKGAIGYARHRREDPTRLRLSERSDRFRR